MGSVWVFQHLAAEPPGLIADVLGGHGHGLRTFRTDLGQAPNGIDEDCDGLVVMGGPMSAYDGGRHPWLEPELEPIRGALRAGLPLMGVCLGSQLLAAAAGARVYPGERPREIGWDTVRLTPAGARDPLCRHLLETPADVEAAVEATVFQWHGDTFDLPQGAELLAASALYAHQAFRIGQCAYGFQFHFEVSAQTIAEWMALWPQELDAAGVDPAAMRGQTARHMEAFTRRGRALISAFAEMLPGGANGTARAAARPLPA